MRNRTDLVEAINKLKNDLEQAHRDIADGVRDWLDVKDVCKKLNQENNALRDMLSDTIASDRNLTKQQAKEVVDRMLEERMLN